MPVLRTAFQIAAVAGVAASLPCAAMAQRSQPEGRSPATEPRPRMDIPVLSASYWYTGAHTLGAGQPQPLRLEAHTLRFVGMLGHRFERTRTTLFAALRYDATVCTARRGADPEQEDVYHGPFARIGAAQGISDRWGLLAYGVIGVASDMEDVALRDVRLTIGAGATYRWSPRLRIAFGAMYTTAFYLPLPLPLINVHYRRGPLRLQLLVPKGASAWLAVRRWLDLGLVGSVLNLRYGLHAPDRFADEYNALNVMLGPAMRLFIHRGIYARVDGGYNVRFFRMTRAEVELHRELTFGGFFFAASAGYLL